jgi:glycosyltransferase involved in cell wall biosynthesis
MDGASTDGTVEWLKAQANRVRWISEPDRGMYDAVNKGLRLATGAVCAYLNADEQYLPGALRTVLDYFTTHPEVDVVVGDVVVVDGAGAYRCSRQVLVPRLHHTVVCHLYSLTCATFFRRRLLETGLSFNPSYRVAGDAEWMARVLTAGVRVGHIKAYLAAFTDDGQNLGLSVENQREHERLMAAYPGWWQAARFLWLIEHRFRRLRSGYYRPAPFQYSIFTDESPARRVVSVSQPNPFWRNRW